MPGSSVHGDSPEKNTGVGCHALLQGILPTQGSNPGVLHYSQILYQLSHQGTSRIVEWAAYPFSRGSSRPRDRTQVSRIAGGFLPAEPPGSPRILEWVAFPFSRGSSQTRHQAGVSCIARGFACNAGGKGDPSCISGRARGGGNGNPLQYSCLENSMGRGAWWATVHGVAKSGTQLNTAQQRGSME